MIGIHLFSPNRSVSNVIFDRGTHGLMTIFFYQIPLLTMINWDPLLFLIRRADQIFPIPRGFLALLSPSTMTRRWERSRIRNSSKGIRKLERITWIKNSPTLPPRVTLRLLTESCSRMMRWNLSRKSISGWMGLVWSSYLIVTIGLSFPYQQRHSRMMIFQRDGSSKDRDLGVSASGSSSPSSSNCFQ